MNENHDLFGNVIIDSSEDVYQSKKIKDLSSQTQTEYIIEVVCTDEKHQEQMYNELKAKGLKCRVLTL